MALASAYQALSDAQLRQRVLDVSAQPASDARTAELAVLSEEVDRRRAGGTAAGGSIWDGLTRLVGATGAPAHEAEQTAMWTSIAVIAGVIAILAVVFAVVHFTNRI